MPPQNSSDDMQKAEIPKVAIEASEDRIQKIADEVENIDRRLKDQKNIMEAMEEERENAVIEAGEIGKWLTEEVGQTEKRWDDRVRLIHDGDIVRAMADDIDEQEPDPDEYLEDTDVPF